MKLHILNCIYTARYWNGNGLCWEAKEEVQIAARWDKSVSRWLFDEQVYPYCYERLKIVSIQ